jgi:hypothetical protein
MTRKSFNKTQQKEIKYAVFDIETHKWIHPYAVGFFDGENYKEFLGRNCIKDFLTEIVRKKYRGYRIYAHNGGKFDFNFLMDVLKSRNFNVDMIFQGSRCLLLKLYTQVYRNEEGAITHSNVIQFVDSISLLKFGLDALTKDFDVQHKKLNFMDKQGSERDYEYLYRLYLERDKRFHDYLTNDVYGLYEVLTKFKKLIMENNGQMGMTIASTSLKTFQTGYLDKKINMTNRESNDEMKKGYYGGRCFSSDTEILTNNGWKSYLNIKETDLIATYNKGNLEYKPSMWIHREYVNEEMINIKGKNIDLLCTNDHRVYYKNKNKKGKMKVCFARDIPLNQIAIPTSAITLNNKSMNKNKAYLIGFIIGDGYVDIKGKRTFIYQAKPNICKKLEHIFDIEKIKVNKKLIKKKGSKCFEYKRNYNTYEYYISCKHGFHKYFNKTLPKRELLNYNYKTLISLFNGMIESDGYKRKDSNGYRYYTSNKYIADFMMELCIKLGYRCNIHKRKNRDQYDLNISVGGYINLNIGSHHNLKKVKYNGVIWCVKTENKTVIARRNGKHLVSGNTEIFRMILPENKYRCYDVNSLYPYVMFNNEFPISKPKTIHNPTKQMIKEYCGITECTIVAPEKLYLPVLPYKLKLGGHNKLVFPLGKFNGYWDNLQLQKAMEIGYKVIPKKMMVFETDYIFKDYVNNFYKLKQNSQSGTPSYILAKLMLNSLYGKFAQNQDSEMVVKVNNPKDMVDLDIVGVVDPDHNLFRVKTESKGNFFIPQISIHVTALAQLRLYEFMEKLIDKGKIVSYCDTDSLFTDGHLPTSNKLGDMKNEYEFAYGYFMLPKTYCIIKKDGSIKVKAKGFTRDFQNQLNEKSFKKALLKKDYSDFKITSDLEVFNSMKTSFVRHKNFVSTDIRKKSIHAVYDKRKILKDYDTIPLII